MTAHSPTNNSITTSVMQFPYHGLQMNLLDTPGHADFSEDTYRTLHAVDGAVMLLDCAKGVEPQTKKLFRVCKQRKIPIFTWRGVECLSGRDSSRCSTQFRIRVF